MGTQSKLVNASDPWGVFSGDFEEIQARFYLSFWILLFLCNATTLSSVGARRSERLAGINPVSRTALKQAAGTLLFAQLSLLLLVLRLHGLALLKTTLQSAFFFFFLDYHVPKHPLMTPQPCRYNTFPLNASKKLSWL